MKEQTSVVRFGAFHPDPAMTFQDSGSYPYHLIIKRMIAFNFNLKDVSNSTVLESYLQYHKNIYLGIN